MIPTSWGRAWSFAIALPLLAVLWMSGASVVNDATLPRARPHARPVAGPVKHHAALPQRVLVSRRAAVAPGPHPRPIAVPTVPDLRATLIAIHQRHVLRRQALARLHRDLSLHAIGAQLYTAWNAPITIKALNWYGFEYAPFVVGGLDHAPLDAILARVHTLGFNTLRIMFANETVERNPVVTQGLDANPELKGLRALDIMDRILWRAHRHGLRVILCNSRSEAGRGPELATGLWYTPKYPASAWQADWTGLVTRFRRRNALIGVDLRNEPHIVGAVFDTTSYFEHGPLWGAFNGTYYHDHDWRYAAQTMGNTLLGINPHILIVVEGVQMYLDPFKKVLTGALWGSNLEGVQYDPIVLSHPGHLVYSVHEYGPKMWLGSWFLNNTGYGNLAARWDLLWGYLLTSPSTMRAPIFVGEFGTCHDYPSCIDDPGKPWSQGFWFHSFVRYLHSHPEVGWAYWSLNPEGPFQANEINGYSVVDTAWHHVYPLVMRGLAPLLGKSTG